MVELLFPLRRLFEWVDAFPSSIAIRESQYLYPSILTSHVVSMCLFAGLVLMMDLRLLGFISIALWTAVAIPARLIGLFT